MNFEIEFFKPSKQQKLILDVIDLLPNLLVQECGGTVIIKENKPIRYALKNGQIKETKRISFVITKHITEPYATYLIILEKMAIVNKFWG